MGHIKEPKGVDFIIQSEPLTESDRKAISEYILKNKNKNAKGILTKKKVFSSKKQLVHS
jgi:hypothetical protein